MLVNTRAIVLNTLKYGESQEMCIRDSLDNPNSGEYWLDGEPVGKLKESERTKYRRGRIGFVFQSFNLIDELLSLIHIWTLESIFIL